MNSSIKYPALFFAGCCACFALFMSIHFVSANQAEPKAASDVDQPAVVEVKMHDLMENVFQPTYRRLKAALIEQPKDVTAWRGIKSDALILAEGTNLLFLRLPEKDITAWKQFAAQSRESGKTMYLASKETKYEETKQSFANMLVQCNKCHTQFADGKYQLKP